MEKIFYQSPKMEVVELKGQVTLLAGSDFSEEPPGDGGNGDDVP